MVVDAYSLDIRVTQDMFDSKKLTLSGNEEFPVGTVMLKVRDGTVIRSYAGGTLEKTAVGYDLHCAQLFSNRGIRVEDTIRLGQFEDGVFLMQICRAGMLHICIIV